MAIWKIFKLSSRTLRGLEGFRSNAELIQQDSMIIPN
jgi:hypothetical protein